MSPTGRGTYHIAGVSAVNAHADRRDWSTGGTCSIKLRALGGAPGSAVHTAPLPRADKTVARKRDHATEIVGLRELSPGLLVRPDNLAGGVDGLRERMIGLGLEREALVFRLDELGGHDADARRLWSALSLDERYRGHIAGMDEVADRIASLPADEAARQAFLVGNRAIHDIVLDPLLPEPLVDPTLRRAFVDRMIAFDDLGREAWYRVLGTELALRRSPQVEVG